jgi:VWFA-related protein
MVQESAEFSRAEVQSFMLCRKPCFSPNLIDFLKAAGFSFVLSLFALIPCTFAQDTAAKTAPQQATVVTVDEVSLNMVVRDSKGKVVPDLKPGDIAVTDGGVPVKISSLRLATGEANKFVTLVFDRFDSAGGQNSRAIATKILKLLPQEGFSIGVMKAQGRLMLYQNFTSDRQQLADALIFATDDEKAGGSKLSEDAEKRLLAIAKRGSVDGGAIVTPSERSAAQALVLALQQSQRSVQELHTRPGLAGLLALARSERALGGRKTIIYFSQGLPSDNATDAVLQDIIGAANRSGVTVYTVDANALTAQADQSMVAMMAIGNVRSASAQSGSAPAYNAATLQPVPQGPPGLAPMVSNQMDRYESADPNGNRSPMAALAVSTGGAFVASGEDIKKPVRRMIEDMTTYYEASYASPVQEYDGQFRPITVKATRSGLKINARSGYFALPPASGQAIRPFEAPLLKMLAESKPPSDVAFQAGIVRLGELATGNENEVVVSVPLSSLETRNDPNTNLYSLQVSVVAQIRNKSGVVLEHFGEDIPRHGALNGKDSAPAITMQRHFTAEPGSYVLEAAVFDQISGKAGAKRVEFEIPSATEGPFLSDLAMVQRIDPVPQDADSSEPMRYGNGRVVPTVADQIAKGTKELSLFFVVHSDAASTESPKLEMEIQKSDESIAKVPLTLSARSGPVTIPYLTSIKSERLPAGDYKIIERLTQGGKTVERSLAFKIQGPQPDPATVAGKDDAEQIGMQVPVDLVGDAHVVITTLPKDAVPPPTAEQVQQLIEAARSRAVAYSTTLPNFLCVEITNRSVDESGKGQWKHRDSIAELLSYHDKSESRTTLEVNGKRSKLTRAEMNSSWPLSVGEFGAMLNLVFQPMSKSEFAWKEAASMGDGSGTVQVLTYRVARENATIVLGQGSDEAGVGFHGSVYIDPTTSGVKRITLVADDIPKSLAIRGAAMTVDYDFVSISGRDYLMPVRSSVTLQRAHRKIERNEITFRNYRRYASRAKIKILQ